MNKLQIRIICLMTAVMLILTMTACGSKKKGAESSAPSGSSEEVSSVDDTESTDEASSESGDTEGETSSDDTVLKPQSSASSKNSGTSSVGSNSSKTSGPSQVITDDLTLKTSQEKKFAALKGTTIRIVATPEELKEGSNTKAKFDYYQKKYDVKYDIVSESWNGMVSKLGQMVAAGNPPDCVFYTENEFLKWTYSNVLQPLDPFIVKDDPHWTNLSLEYFKTNNKIYGIPTGTPDTTLAVFMVYFNKTLFEEQKKKDGTLKTPYEHYKAGTWTWDNLIKTAEKMTLFREDGTTVRTNGIACWNSNVYVMANGGDGMIESKPGIFEPSYTKALSMKGLEVIEKLAKQKLMTSDPYSGFANRAVAMHVERPGNAVGQFDYYNTMDDEIGVAPLPAASDGKYYAPVTCYALGVPRKSKNPLGGAMIAYENLKQEKRQFDSPSDYDKASFKQKISDEHYGILKEYYAKATPKHSFVEGLAGWQEDAGYSTQFWGKLWTDKKTATVAVGEMEGILKTAIKRTTGN